MSTHNPIRSNPSGKINSTAAAYKRWAEQNADAGNWFPFSRSYLKLMSPAAAVLLQSLINLGKYKCHDGWVNCTAAFVEDSLGMSNKVQKRVFAELKRLGYVETKVAGMPAVRWASVNLEKLWTDRDRVIENGHCPVRPKWDQPVGPKRDHNKETPTESLITPKTVAQNGAVMEPLVESARSTKLIEPTAISVGYADSLQRAAQESKVYTSRYNRMKSARAFTVLINEVDYPRVEKTLSWYFKHMTDQYVPRALCGTSFRKKFAAIEAAMERLSNSDANILISHTAVEIINDLVPHKEIENKDLAAAVELSLRNMMDFRAKLRNAKNPLAAVLLVEGGIRNAKQFVYSWFWNLLKWYKHKLVPKQVISVDSPQFQKWGSEFAASPSKWGTARDWSKLMKEIGHAN